jgi:hypothetical protein
VRSSFLSLAVIAVASCAPPPAVTNPSPLTPAARLAGCYRLEVQPAERERNRPFGGSPAYVRLDTVSSDTASRERRLRATWLPERARPRSADRNAPASDRELTEIRPQLDSLFRTAEYWWPVAGGDSVRLVRGIPETASDVYRLAVRRGNPGRPQLVGMVTFYSDDIPAEGFPSSPVLGRPVECLAAQSRQ